MDVVHICQRDDPKTGGAVQVAALLVKHLNEIEGINARLLFLYGGPGYFASQLPGLCSYLGLRSSRQAIVGAAKLRSILRRANIVHHHDSLIWPSVASITCPNVRRVVHVHIAPRRPANWKMKLSWLAQKCRIARLVTISDAMSSTCADRGVSKSRIFKLGNTIDRERFQSDPDARSSIRRSLQIADHRIVVGSVGRLETVMKGTDDFVRTLSHLPSEYVGLIVGDGEHRQKLEQQAKELGLSERIVFVGAINDPERYYSAMDAFLFTSHYEHFGLAPLEAIAAGLPVYAFRCEGGFAEWANPQIIWHATDRDIEQMATTINFEMSTGHWVERSKRALEWVCQSFSPPSAARQLAQMYEQILRT